MKTNRQFFPNSIMQGVLLLLIWIVLMVILYGISTLTGLNLKISIEQHSVILNIISSFFIISFFKFINRSLDYENTNYLKYNKIKLFSIIFFIVVIYQFGISFPIFDRVVYLPNINQVINPLSKSKIEILSILIVAPILEESIFRGIILKGFLLRYEKNKSILISAIIFSIVHFNIANFYFRDIINPFIIGLFLGWIYSNTRKIYICIGIHSSLNCCGFIISYIIYYLQNNGNQFYELKSNICLITAVFSMILIFYLIKTLKNSVFNRL